MRITVDAPKRAGRLDFQPARNFQKNRLTVGPNHEKLASLKQNHTAKRKSPCTP